MCRELTDSYLIRDPGGSLPPPLPPPAAGQKNQGHDSFLRRRPTIAAVRPSPPSIAPPPPPSSPDLHRRNRRPPLRRRHPLRRRPSAPRVPGGLSFPSPRFGLNPYRFGSGPRPAQTYSTARSEPILLAGPNRSGQPGQGKPRLARPSRSGSGYSQPVNTIGQTINGQHLSKSTYDIVNGQHCGSRVTNTINFQQSMVSLQFAPL